MVRHRWRDIGVYRARPEAFLASIKSTHKSATIRMPVRKGTIPPTKSMVSEDGLQQLVDLGIWRSRLLAARIHTLLEELPL